MSGYACVDKSLDSCTRTPPTIIENNCGSAICQASDRVVLATGIVMSGCIILVCFGDHQSKVLTVDDMIGLYRRCLFSPTLPRHSCGLCREATGLGMLQHLAAVFLAGNNVVKCVEHARSPVYLCYLLFLGAGSAAFFGLYQHSKQALE